MSTQRERRNHVATLAHAEPNDGGYFSDADLRRVEILCAGLSREEVLAIFYVKEDELTPADLDQFDRAFIKGRAEAKATAVQCLFNQMAGRDGVKGALAYLVRFGDDWPVVEEEQGKKGEGHTFKVSFPTMRQ